jgi:hypothetical protein
LHWLALRRLGLRDLRLRGRRLDELAFGEHFGAGLGRQRLDLLDEIDRDDVVIDGLALQLDGAEELRGNRHAVGGLRGIGDVMIEVAVDDVELRGEGPREVNDQSLAFDLRLVGDRRRPLDRDAAIACVLAGAQLDFLGGACGKAQRSERQGRKESGSALRGHGLMASRTRRGTARTADSAVLPWPW